MKNAEIFDKIEAYLHEDLNAKEKAAFEKEMAQNPDLAEQVDMHRFEWDGMEVILEDDLRSQMAQWQEEETQVQTTPSISGSITSLKVVKEGDAKVVRLDSAKHNMRRLYYNIALAASFAILAGAALWVFTKPNPQTDVVKNDKPPVDTIARLPLPTPIPQSIEEAPIVNIEKKPTDPNTKPIESKNTRKQEDAPVVVTTPKNDLIVPEDKTYIAYAEEAYQKSDVPTYEDIQSTRGGGDEKDSLMEEAGKAYDKKEFDKAINLLRNTPLTDENFNALEILAHAQFQKKNYAAALPIFQNLLQMSGKKSRQKTEWYLLLCYLTNGAKSKTDFDILSQKILTNEAHDYHKNAVLLMGKLKK